MKCCACSKVIIDETNAISVSPDGDFVCNKGCQELYDKSRQYFFDVIIADNKRYQEWWSAKKESPEEINPI